jgi:predicted AAA+ superfamily ATPase
MAEPDIYPRFASAMLEEALADTPVVLVHGPRQCGKTTLARMVGKSLGHAYITFDDDTQLAAAASDPAGFVANLPAKVVLDEVQRVPDLFLALKSAVDRDRKPGRFILTGSANVLLLPKLADSLAGRMEILRLHPFSQCELARTRSGFLDSLFTCNFPHRPLTRLGPDLAGRIAAGGFPAALTRPASRRRTAWYRDYVETMVQRDVRELARIGSLDALPRLLQLAAGQTARLMNVAELAGPFQLSRPTIRDYVTLLERIFLLEHLPPWHSNRLRRLIKTPKLHLTDTGLAATLLGLDAVELWKDRAAFGQLLETFVFQELRRQASWQETPVSFFHFRDKDGAEVDLVLERGARSVAGIEVKASATVTASDFSGLRKLKAASGDRFAAGVVLYDGEGVASFGEALFAVPIRALWETGTRKR